jgi:hypothetical protein
MLRLALALGLVVGCGKKSDGGAMQPLELAKQVFGPNQNVWAAPVTVPNARVFLAVPDPTPNDYDGYQVILLPDGQQAPLRGADAVRFAWDQNVRDAESLARIAALFVGRSQQVAGAAERDRPHIRDRERIQDPVIADDRLVFWVVRGSMQPTASEVIVDLTTFEAREGTP